MVNDDWRKGAAAEYAAKRQAAVERRSAALEDRARAERVAIEAEQEIAALDQGARVFGLSVPEVADVAIDLGGEGNIVVQAKTTPHAPRQFKDVALSVLKEAYPKPVKAMHVQSAAENELGRQFHWKTAGMTLYRLKQDGLARREGQNWFYAPPSQTDLEELMN